MTTSPRPGSNSPAENYGTFAHTYLTHTWLTHLYITLSHLTPIPQPRCENTSSRSSDIESNLGPAAAVDQRDSAAGHLPERRLPALGASNSNTLPRKPARSHACGTRLTSSSPNGNVTQLELLYLNARSIVAKHAELNELVAAAASPPHLIAISETWLNGDVPDGSVILPGYSNLFRVDRAPPRRGGGVMILARDDVKCIRRADLQLWMESVWIEVDMGSFGKPLVVGCVYRPPSSSSADVEHFVDCMDATEKVDHRSSHVAIVGDFNATSPQWCSTDVFNAAGRRLDPFFLRLGLHQAVSFPTHLRPDGCFGSLLDLLLVSHPGLVSRVSSLPPPLAVWITLF